jgi:hypothetical protein
MTPKRPELEYGREFGGLLIVGCYCLCAFFLQRSPRGHSVAPG